MSLTLKHFALEATSGQARAATLKTAHGEIQTPVFMPVGTKATVKSMTPHDLKDIGSQIILGNTYHLHLRPTEKLIAQMGGLHKFMNWDQPILTDSGGFQVFSLSKLRKITDDGVEFRSHLDGTKLFISPEKSMEIQMDLGSDIIMAFDECPPYPCTKDELYKAMDRTIKWLRRCKDRMTRPESLLFGIAQGGLDFEARKIAIEQVAELDLPGYALGGFSVGEPMPLMHALLPEVVPLMPANKPRYLMGVGKPEDLLIGINSGIDMFDCVMPTRVARNGMLFTWNGPINIKRKEFQLDERPIDEECGCYTCTNFTRSYLRHLFSVGELLSFRLNTLHNLYFYHDLMRQARAAILEDRWESFFTKTLTRLIRTPHATQEQ
ncbi:MAG: tRNA guanosine(34) transglycosylase Tgt [Bdellovibrionaceae bacterium]|nr:tRNA guanosine(34) transglycosylase Tgt [Pseudobdellovibrionaceae bacterium]